MEFDFLLHSNVVYVADGCVTIRIRPNVIALLTAMESYFLNYFLLVDDHLHHSTGLVLPTCPDNASFPFEPAILYTEIVLKFILLFLLKTNNNN